MTVPHPLIVRASERTPENESKASHPQNPNSEIHGWMLAKRVGLKRTGLNLMRVPPGKESFVYHSHRFEEEFVFVLSGRAVMEIDGQEHELGPGDFVGFPTPSAAHHLKNPFSEDVVYLSGGENREFEVADFPRLDKRMVRAGNDVTIFPLAAAERWW